MSKIFDKKPWGATFMFTDDHREAIAALTIDTFCRSAPSVSIDIIRPYDRQSRNLLLSRTKYLCGLIAAATCYFVVRTKS